MAHTMVFSFILGEVWLARPWSERRRDAVAGGESICEVLFAEKARSHRTSVEFQHTISKGSQLIALKHGRVQLDVRHELCEVATVDTLLYRACVLHHRQITVDRPIDVERGHLASRAIPLTFGVACRRPFYQRSYPDWRHLSWQ